ncbi:MAG: hypothetical protein K9L82_04340 [Chromatiaceae bacterium]|nr:hypothetical protein [Chromatiaceae bacterium]
MTESVVGDMRASVFDVAQSSNRSQHQGCADCKLAFGITDIVSLMLAKLISLLLLTLLGVLLFGLMIWWLQPKWSQPGLAVGTRAASSTSTRGYADALRRFRAVVTSRH